MVSVQESRNISVSNNMLLAFSKGNGTSYFIINQNFPMNTFNLTIFVINNISVIIVNILVLIWLQVLLSNILKITVFSLLPIVKLKSRSQRRSQVRTKDKDLDLGYTLNLVCYPPPLTTKLFLASNLLQTITF